MAERGEIKDMSMLELFRLETENQTAVLAAQLLELEQNPSSEQKLETLMRAAHSMKGAARIVGFETVVRIAHKMEDCFVAAQRQELFLTGGHIDILLSAVDFIIRVAQVAQGDLQQWLQHHQGFVERLLRQLDAIQNRKECSSEDALVPPAVNVSQSRERGQGSHVEQFESDQGPGEPVLRVDANRLTRLVGLSSELMVEARWLRPYANSMLQLKKRYGEISGLLERLREGLHSATTAPHHAGILAEAQRKLTDCRSVLTERLLALDDYDRRNSNLSSKVYHELLASKMRPFTDCTHGLQRMARDMARTLSKQVRIVFNGLDTTVDRDVLDKLKAPLNHLVRNAIDHGVELPQHRATLGKNPQGTLKVQAQHLGGMLVVTVADDGRGIDFDSLKSKILQKKLVTKEVLENLTEAELLEFLYLPDFSTRNEVSEYSGRGVGLDAVKNLVRQGKGSIKITSIRGEGSKFTIQMPLSLSVVSGLLVNIADEPYAFPLSRVEMLASVPQTQLRVFKSQLYAEINGELIGLVSARQLFTGRDDRYCRHGMCHIVIIASATNVFDNIAVNAATDVAIDVVTNQSEKYGVIVDSFAGQKELAVQTLDSRLSKVQDISAAALTVDGLPVLILDVDDLFRSIETHIAAHIAEGANGQRVVPAEAGPVAKNQTPDNPKTVLVIDDSMTLREIERQLLQTHGYRVDVAVDGMDGWNAVRRKKYHLVITDVDMPRMDGIELLHAIRQDSHLKALPVMIISYKDRPEDKQRGLDAGADYYIAKGSFHDETFIEAVVDLIGEPLS